MVWVVPLGRKWVWHHFWMTRSVDGFRHSWQGPFFSRNNTSLDLGTCFGDFALIPGHEKDVERHLEKGTPSFSP